MSDIQPNAASSGSRINFSDLYARYKSKWWWFAISLAVCVGLTAFYCWYRSPKYRINATVLIAEDDGGGGAASLTKAFSLGGMFGGESSVDDELEVMRSYSTIYGTAKELELNRIYFVREQFPHRYVPYGNSPIEVEYDKAIADTLQHYISFYMRYSADGELRVSAEVDKVGDIGAVKGKNLPLTLDTSYGKFVFNKTPFLKPGKAFREMIIIDSYASAAENLALDLSITNLNKKTNIISLSIIDKVPQRGKDILNTVVKRYNAFGIQEKQLKDQKTAKFIDDRLASLTNELQLSDKDIENYKRQNNLTDLAAEGEYQMKRRSSYEGLLTEAETGLEILNITKRFISDPSNNYSLIPNVGDYSEAADNAINAYNSLVLRRMNLDNNAKGNNKALQNISEQLDAMRVNIATTLNRAIEGAKVRVSDLKAKTNEADARLGNIPRQEREFIDLTRKHTIQEQLYMYLLQQREETQLSIVNSQPRGQIVDEAYREVLPVNNSWVEPILLAILIGLFIPVGILYLKQMLRTKFTSREEAERLVSAPVLGEISKAMHDYPQSIAVKGTHTIAELFRLVRTNLQFMLNGKDHNVVMVTSTTSGEGKSFIAINLAASLAVLEKKVLLVGMDIRKPQLANFLGLKSQPGLTQYLSTDAMTPADIIQHCPGMDTLDVIVAGPIPPNPSELLSSPKVTKLFDEMRRLYDYIIIDSAPVGMVSDSFILASLADATVYVVRASYTKISDLKFVNGVYTNKRLKNMAVVVNATDIHKGTGYGYGYGNQSES